MASTSDGFDDLRKHLEKLKDQIEEASETKSIGLSELLSPEFLSSCSEFSSLEEMFEASGFDIKTAEDFQAIPESDWEWFIQQNTSYPSWLDMQQDAASVWMQKKLDL